MDDWYLSIRTGQKHMQKVIQNLRLILITTIDSTPNAGTRAGWQSTDFGCPGIFYQTKMVHHGHSFQLKIESFFALLKVR